MRAGGGVTYPSVLQALINENVNESVKVANCGVGGETSLSICARAGVYQPLAVAESVTIPAEKNEVEIKLTSSVLRQGGQDAFQPCVIGGVKGNLRIEQESISSPEYRYFFKRTEGTGESVTLGKDTVVRSLAYESYADYVSIIFIGQNGGWEDNAELIAQQRALIERTGADRDRFLILGITSSGREYRAALENAMQEEYGDKYVNLREYLSTEGFEKSGITPTEQDLTDISTGCVPQSLRVDSVHFNAKGYTLIGNYAYERMRQLGYLDSLRK